jgi:CBS domain-containing protein
MTAPQTLNRLHSRAVPPLYRVSVGEAMHRGVLAVPLAAPLSEVAETMAKHRVHCIVALGESHNGRAGRVWGLVSDLELTRIACTEGLQGRTAGGSATTEVVTVEPADTVHHAAELMAKHGVSHVIVVDPLMDRPVGVLSTLDVAQVLTEGVPRPRGNAYYVAQLMTPDVLGVQPDTPLKEVAQLLSDRGISGVPVVEGETVLGVVSQTDIVAKERAPATKRGRFARWLARSPRPAERDRYEARTAGEVMTSPAITIESWRTVADAAAVMLNRDVDRLPVLTEGKLVGIITRADLVGAFSRSDKEIERDIREEVVLRSFWIPEGDIEIRVRGGEVTLAGIVESELLAELLPEAIRGVPGVVGVRSKLKAAPGAPDDPPRFERLYSPR